MKLTNYKNYAGKFWWDEESDGAGLYVNVDGDKSLTIRFTWSKISKRGYVDYIKSEVVQDTSNKRSCKTDIYANLLLDEDSNGAVFEIVYPEVNHKDSFHVDFRLTDEALKSDFVAYKNSQDNTSPFEYVV